MRPISATAILTVVLAMLPGGAGAVQWKPLTSTARHHVAIDEDSVRLTALGRLATWLRFVPIGEAQRRAAAAEYGEKGYRSHLEYYEIDCSDQSAVLGLIDIFGTSTARLKRLKGSPQPDAIIPGSVLDRAAQRVCPAIDDEEYQEEPESPAPEPAAEKDTAQDGEVAEKIEGLARKAAAEPGNSEAWRQLGNACFDADRYEEAIAAYGRALALKPDDTDILNDQGAMYRQTGDFARSLSNFEKALKIDPYNLESLYNSGYVYAFDLNNIPKALEAWRSYLKLDTRSETARQVQSFVERYQKLAN